MKSFESHDWYEVRRRLLQGPVATRGAPSLALQAGLLTNMPRQMFAASTAVLAAVLNDLDARGEPATLERVWAAIRSDDIRQLPRSGIWIQRSRDCGSNVSAMSGCVIQPARLLIERAFVARVVSARGHDFSTLLQALDLLVECWVTGELAFALRSKRKPGTEQTQKAGAFANEGVTE